MKCSQCGQITRDSASATEGPISGRAVARVANLAEAGYLVSLLEAEGIEATVHPVESFNAVSGVWTLAHQLSVAEDRALDAARVLRAEADARLDAAEPAETRQAAYGDSYGVGGSDEPANLIRPLTLLLVAAAVAWGLLGRHGAGKNGRAVGDTEPAAALGPALRALGLPLYAADGPNRPLHRFRFDAEAACWELASDADRDGDFETLRRFQAVAAN